MWTQPGFSFSEQLPPTRKPLGPARFGRTRSGMRLIPLLALVSGCTAVNFTAVPTQRVVGEIFVTAQGAPGPYESAGIVQVTKRGVLLFGFADPAETDLTGAIDEVQVQVRRAGADGLVNTRIEQTSYTTLQRILGLIFFFAPLPSEVTVTGELVRLRRAAAPQPPPLPTTGGTTL